MGIFGWSYPAGAASDPYAPYNDNEDYETMEETTAKLTRSQRDKIKRIRARLAKAATLPPTPVPTFAEVWQLVGEMLAEQGKARYEEEEAGDWTPYWCDDCEKWHKTAHAFDWDAQGEVMEGKKGPVIEVRTVDEDGNWDFESATYEGDKYWEDFYRAWMTNDSYFKGRAEYHLWCAEHGGVDPLEEFYSTPTVDGHIAAAQDMVKYLFKRRK